LQRHGKSHLRAYSPARLALLNKRDLACLINSPDSRTDFNPLEREPHGATEKRRHVSCWRVGGSQPQEVIVARKYSKKASSKVKRAMHERKSGSLRSGRSKKKVKSRKQAIAIGLSEARRSGAKVPKKKGAKKKSRKKK
jgi:hypothetical protein